MFLFQLLADVGTFSVVWVGCVLDLPCDLEFYFIFSLNLSGFVCGCI